MKPININTPEVSLAVGLALVVNADSQEELLEYFEQCEDDAALLDPMAVERAKIKALELCLEWCGAVPSDICPGKWASSVMQKPGNN